MIQIENVIGYYVVTATNGEQEHKFAIPQASNAFLEESVPFMKIYPSTFASSTTMMPYIPDCKVFKLNVTWSNFINRVPEKWSGS